MPLSHHGEEARCKHGRSLINPSSIPMSFSSRIYTLALAAVLIAPACASSTKQVAPFRARPDSVTSGDLRGPFSGQVKDRVSGDPVAGAIVYAAWSFSRDYAFAQSAGFHEVTTSTDIGGRYTIPALKDALGKSKRLADFQLVIYKKGYVAYRSDRYFSDFSPRRDFAQKGNQVTLDRFREEFSHARHLRYVGGGPAMSALTRFELSEASAELSGTRGVSAPLLASPFTARVGARVVAATVLGDEEIREITGFEGELESGPLGGEPDTEGYSSQHFRALGQPESFDIALRLWQVSEGQSMARFDELEQSLPGVERTNTLGDASLQASEGDIFGIAFAIEKSDLVMLLSCGTSQCQSVEIAEALAERAVQNIGSQTERGAR